MGKRPVDDSMAARACVVCGLVLTPREVQDCAERGLTTCRCDRHVGSRPPQAPEKTTLLTNS